VHLIHLLGAFSCRHLIYEYLLEGCLYQRGYCSWGDVGTLGLACSLGVTEGVTQVVTEGVTQVVTEGFTEVVTDGVP